MTGRDLFNLDLMFVFSSIHCFYFDRQVPTVKCDGKNVIQAKKTERSRPQNVLCKKLKDGSTKLWLKDDEAYVLINAGKASRNFTDGKTVHEEGAEKIIVDYFIR